jgi:hypothetical protein
MRWQRLPLHPRPQAQEALSSWIGRLAAVYDLGWEEFFDQALALPSTPMSNVDRDPPVALLDRLTAQTGISLPQLRAMTLHGYVPFLIDGINPTEKAFEVYGGSFTTLMSPAARRRVPLGRPWAPWVDPKWLERRYGCPSCLAADVVPHHRIPWRLPWMASCPVHGMLLEKVFIPTGPSQAYAEYHRTIGTPATPELRLIDGITRTAVIDGMVYLSNGERISAAVWVRKLRGLIDEVTRPSLVVRSARAVIGSAWVAVAGRFRAGLGRWHPFEEMPIDKQAIVLRVTGVVVGAMLKGENPVATSAYPRSVSDREFLRPTPPPRADLRSVYVATQIKASGQSKLQPEMDEPDVLIVRAQSDRTAAYEIRRLLVGSKHSPERIAAIERDLRALGIPIVTNIVT